MIIPLSTQCADNPKFDIAADKLCCRATLNHNGQVDTVAFNADGSRIITASKDLKAYIWDARHGSKVLQTLSHNYWINSVAYNQQGTQVVTASGDTAYTWEAETGKMLLVLKHIYDAAADEASPAKESRLLSAGSGMLKDEDENEIFNLGIGMLHEDAYGTNVYKAVFNPTGTRIATANEDGTARIWDAQQGKLLHSLKHKEKVKSAEFNQRGTHLVTTSDNEVYLWDVEKGDVLKTLWNYYSPSNAIFNPTGTHILYTGDDSAYVWNIEHNYDDVPKSLYHRNINSAAFCEDGNRIITAGGTDAYIWNTDGAMLLTLHHDKQINKAAFNKEGTLVVTACNNGAYIWDAQDGELLYTLPQEVVLSAAFNQSGSQVATAGRDGRVCLWRLFEMQPFDIQDNKIVISVPNRIAEDTGIKQLLFDLDDRDCLAYATYKGLIEEKIKSANPNIGSFDANVQAYTELIKRQNLMQFSVAFTKVGDKWVAHLFEKDNFATLTQNSKSPLRDPLNRQPIRYFIRAKNHTNLQQ